MRANPGIGLSRIAGSEPEPATELVYGPKKGNGDQELDDMCAFARKAIAISDPR
jgi:hypothetical protein